MTNSRNYQANGEQINRAGIVWNFLQQAPANLDSRIPQAPTPPLTLTVKEMAQALNISRATAYKLAASEDFPPSFRVGGRLLIGYQRLVDWVNNGGTNNGKAC